MDGDTHTTDMVGVVTTVTAGVVTTAGVATDAAADTATTQHHIIITATITTHITMAREMAGVPTPMVQVPLTAGTAEASVKNMKTHSQ